MKPTRISFIALIGVMVVSAPDASACQVCTVALTYNALRFTAVWFWILIAWTGLTIIAELRGRSKPPRPHLFGPALWLLGIVFALGLLMGANLLVLLFLPKLMIPVAFRKRAAPNWLVNSARALTAAMLVSIPLAYWVLPMVINEPGTRAKAQQVQSDLRFYATALESYHVDSHEFPIELPTRTTLPVYTRMDGIDPFGYEKMSCRFAELSMFPILADHSGYMRPGPPQSLAYRRDGVRAWVISRGPNTQFDMPLEKLPKLSDNELEEFKYDPTNGMFSRGDIFRAINVATGSGTVSN